MNKLLKFAVTLAVVAILVFWIGSHETSSGTVLRNRTVKKTKKSWNVVEVEWEPITSESVPFHDVLCGSDANRLEAGKTYMLLGKRIDSMLRRCLLIKDFREVPRPLLAARKYLRVSGNFNPASISKDKFSSDGSTTVEIEGPMFSAFPNQSVDNLAKLEVELCGRVPLPSEGGRLELEIWQEGKNQGCNFWTEIDFSPSNETYLPRLGHLQ